MKKTLSYIQPIRSKHNSRIKADALDEAIEKFKSKDYLASIYLVLDFFNSDLRQRYVPDASRKFQLPHGSIVIDVEITDRDLLVSAPFMSIPEGSSRIPMLRRATELNISDLDMAHLYLTEQGLQFKFSCPLELAHPFKVAYMLRELCITGDKYDDEFLVKFSAQRLYEPMLKPYEAESMRRIIAAIRSVALESIAQIDEYEVERKYGKAWNILVTTLFKINYFAQPQGHLQAELEEAVFKAYRDDRPDSELLPEGRQFLQDLHDKSDEELAQSLYDVEVISSRRRSSDIENIRSNTMDAYEEVLSMISSGSIEEAVLLMTQNIYRIYFFNDLQENINEVFAPALEQSAQVDLNTAVAVLHKALKKVMEDMDTAESVSEYYEPKAVLNDLDEIQQIQEQMLSELPEVDMQRYRQVAERVKMAASQSLEATDMNAQ